MARVELRLDKILEAMKRSNPGEGNSKLPADIKRERTLEASRRNSAAQALATKAIKFIHAADYQDLLDQAKASIDKANGPLPGDPDHQLMPWPPKDQQ